MKEIIATENLSKQYKDVLAVSDLSLNVRKGEIYGFLGLNGAGKTTTIRMLLGMIKPTSGSAIINGKRVSPDNTDLWKSIGYLVEVPYGYPELTVRQNLEIIKRLRFITDKHAVEVVMEKLKLTPYADRKAGILSLGNAQRLGLAKALIHNPEVLLLDEPTNGLDPAGIFEIRKLLTDLAREHGVTVFISSHILNEISRYATRIGIIHQGNLIKELNREHLDTLCKKKLILSTRNNETALMLLSQHGFSFNESTDGTLVTENEAAIAQPETLVSLLAANHQPPYLLKVEDEDLESFFLRTIGINEYQR